MQVFKLLSSTWKQAPVRCCLQVAWGIPKSLTLLACCTKIGVDAGTNSIAVQEGQLESTCYWMRELLQKYLHADSTDLQNQAAVND